MLKISQPYVFSHIGRKRNQEDSYAPDAPDSKTRCFVVCDGVGGLAHGEVASGIIARSVERELAERLHSGETACRDMICQTIEKAWKDLDAHAAKEGADEEMATTLVMAVIDAENNTAWIAHIGDSRCYVIRPGEKKVVFVTKDHTIAQELCDMGSIKESEIKSHPLSHTITRAIIPGERTVPEIDAIKLREGDYIFLCSDGIMERMDDHELLKILTTKNKDEEKMRMIRNNTLTAKDNCTAMLVPVEAARHTLSRRLLWIVLLTLALLFLLGSLRTMAQNGSDRQRVATLVMETNTLYKQKDYAQAAERLEEISRIMPELDWPYLRLANIYRMEGSTNNQAKAILCYEKYIAKSKKPAAADSIKRIVASLKKSDTSAEVPATAQAAAVPAAEATKPATSLQPVTTQPVTTQPAPAQPVTTQPVATQPVVTQPAATLPPSTPAAQSATASPTPVRQATSTDAAVSVLDEMFGDNSAAPQKHTETNKPAADTQNDVSMVEIDTNKPLITYRHPFNVLRGDIVNMKNAPDAASMYVSALFNHDNGRDALAFYVDANKQITLNPESDIEKAYSDLMGKNSSIPGTIHGVTDETSCNGNEWRIRLEYNIPDSKDAKHSWREVVDRMVGKYFNQAPVTEQLMLNEMDHIDKNNTGTVNVVYDFNLEQVNGVLYGTGTIKATKKTRVIQTQTRTVSRPPLYVERTISKPTARKNRFVTETVIDTIAQADTTVIDTIKNKEEKFLLASISSTQMFVPMPTTYTVAELQNIPPQEDVENLETLRKEYDDFCTWHKEKLAENYSATEIFNRLSQLSRLYQPEAIYTAYTGYLTGMWALPKNTRIANSYKTRMIRIHNQLTR